jgi:hypothetical protein
MAGTARVERRERCGQHHPRTPDRSGTAGDRTRPQLTVTRPSGTRPSQIRGRSQPALSPARSPPTDDTAASPSDSSAASSLSTASSVPANDDRPTPYRRHSAVPAVRWPPGSGMARSPAGRHGPWAVERPRRSCRRRSTGLMVRGSRAPSPWAVTTGDDAIRPCVYVDKVVDSRQRSAATYAQGTVTSRRSSAPSGWRSSYGRPRVAGRRPARQRSDRWQGRSRSPCGQVTVAAMDGARSASRRRWSSEAADRRSVMAVSVGAGGDGDRLRREKLPVASNVQRQTHRPER